MVLRGVLTGLAISRSRGDILYLNAHENQTTLNSHLGMVPWVRNTVTYKIEDNRLTFVDGFNGVMNDFFCQGAFKVGDGLTTRFWKDTWLREEPLAREYSRLYNIIQQKDASDASTLEIK